MSNAKSVRKQFNEHAGYVASLRSGAGRGWVVIYKADEQGIDVGGARYAVVCDTHATIAGAPSVASARATMKDPCGFCDGCRSAKDAVSRESALEDLLTACIEARRVNFDYALNIHGASELMIAELTHTVAVAKNQVELAIDALTGEKRGKEPMNHYRCTVPHRYGHGTPGHTDPSGRQGHYTDACSPTEARRIIRERLSLSVEEPIDVQVWKH